MDSFSFDDGHLGYGHWVDRGVESEETLEKDAAGDGGTGFDGMLIPSFEADLCWDGTWTGAWAWTWISEIAVVLSRHKQSTVPDLLCTSGSKERLYTVQCI